MNVSQTGVTQAANLSFLMVNLSYYLQKKGIPGHNPKSITSRLSVGEINMCEKS